MLASSLAIENALFFVILHLLYKCHHSFKVPSSNQSYLVTSDHQHQFWQLPPLLLSFCLSWQYCPMCIYLHHGRHRNLHGLIQFYASHSLGFQTESELQGPIKRNLQFSYSRNVAFCLFEKEYTSFLFNMPRNNTEKFIYCYSNRE